VSEALPFEYVGNLHIHSIHSDGAMSPEQIAEVARAVGLDFIALNDHSYLTPLHIEDEGYHKGVLVLVGSEIGTRYHHYLAFNIRTQIDDDNLSAQEVIDAVARQGGFGFLAHPFEKGMPFMENSVAYTWNDWNVGGYTGICIWNFSSRWKENVKTFWHGLYHLLCRTYTVKGPSRKTLATWDELCLKRKVVALGGSDAHGSPIKIGPLRFTPLSYRSVLSTINTHVLTPTPLQGDFSKDKTTIYHSLRAGTCFIAHDGLSSAKGFRFYLTKAKNKQRLEMGEEAPFGPGEAVIKLPARGSIRVIRNGSLFTEGCGRELSIMIGDKGVYRIEVYRKTPLFGLRPWIFSNPIYLR
jgi:hypothetical protein